MFRLVDNWKLKLHELGLNQTTILRQSYLPSNLFDKHQPSITEREYFRLFDVMQRHTEHLPLAIAYAQKVPIEALSPAIIAAFSCTDFNTAIQYIIKYRKLICPLRIKADIKASETIVTIEKLEGGPPPHSTGMVITTLLINLLRLSTKTTNIPKWVSVSEQPTSQSMYEEFFGVPLSDGPKYAFALSAEDASMPFITANLKLVDLLEPSLNRHLFDIDRDVSMTERVQDIIHERLSDGSISVKSVSQLLGRSIRGLQRDLTQENTSFKRILNDTRKEMAYYYLADTDLSIEEIAYRLGFVDSASFFRVFKNWTGKTPRKYRISQVA